MKFLWNFSGDRSRVCKIINFWIKQAYYEILFCFLSFDWRNFLSSPLLRHPWFQYKYVRLALRWKCLVWYPTQLQYPHHCTSACTHAIDSVSHLTIRTRCFCAIHLEREKCFKRSVRSFLVSCSCTKGFGGNRCQHVVCVSLRAAENEVVTCRGNGTAGTLCTLRCKNGAAPNLWRQHPGAQATRTCTAAGRWSGPSGELWGCAEPVAERGFNVLCPRAWETEAAERSSGGTLFATDLKTDLHLARCSDGQAVGSTCQFSCRDEYEMKGANTRLALCSTVRIRLSFGRDLGLFLCLKIMFYLCVWGSSRR